MILTGGTLYVPTFSIQ